ncbi:hypothetical protein BCR34DRAFT_594439 [Clohesyomyces aquaticus]|uniref:Uncharacterized protein n=1 Tax=Clohesyomyces aquaticus TaxID=1231657 RepID=A0A1Y1Y8S2_9PLEO|nr:hypothetical protein BCR34DRAFT_594439 [Clohesyomyces aquaticus]
MLGPNLGLLAAAGAASPLGLLHLGVEEMGLVGDRDFNGISLEFPIVLDNNDADLDVASMCSFSVENVGGVYNKSVALSPMCTLTTTLPLPPRPQACGSYLSPLRLYNDPNAGDADSGGKDNSVKTLDLP